MSQFTVLVKTIRQRFGRISTVLRYCLIALLMIVGVGRVYFHPGFPYTHDGENHLARFANYKIAIKEGQLPPRLAPNLLSHYGYPVFNYNYPLANIVSLPGAFLKLNYELIFKIIALTTLAGLGIGVELWLKSLRFSSGARWLALFTLAPTPFLINTIWFRGNIGELMALALFAWGLWLTENLCHSSANKINWWSWWLAGIILGILLAHNIAALLLLPLLIAYGWWQAKQWSVRWRILALWGWGILASLWFWLPALAEKSLIVLDGAKFFQEYKAHFATVEQLIWSPLRFGFSYAGPVDDLSFSLGLGVVATLGLSVILAISKLFLWLKARLTRELLPRQQLTLSMTMLCGLVSLSLIWLQTPQSLPFWQLIFPLSYVQFPWRLALPVTILVLPLVASWWELAKTYHIGWVRWLLVIAIALSWWPLLQLKAVDYFHRTNIDYEAFGQTTSALNENMPTTFKYLLIGDWQPAPRLLSGEGQITVQLWKNFYRRYQLELVTPAVIVEPSITFAGFETFANKQLVTYINSDVIQGRLAYELPPGSYTVETRFTQHTWPRQAGNAVSLVAMLGWLSWAGWQLVSHIRRLRKNPQYD